MTSPARYAAFLSYSSRHTDWAGSLHRHLELCLENAGRPAKIFWDQSGIQAGDSWVRSLQEGLARSERLILIVTPEAMASPRVGDEWEVFITRFPDWRQGKLLIAHLIDTPLPLFLSVVQQVDFRQHDSEVYRLGLKRLVASLLGWDPATRLPGLPADLVPPRAPKADWPAELRRSTIQWLAPLVRRKSYRHLFAESLGWETDSLDSYPDEACAASAMLVRAASGEEAIAGGLRLFDRLAQELEGEEPQETLSELAALRQQLERAGQGAPGRSLLRIWLDTVAADERLIDRLPHRAEPALLDRVYVRLEMKADLNRVPRQPDSGIPDRPLGIRELLLLDPAEHPWVSRRWLVRGDAGAGKTTLLRHLMASLSEDAEPRWVPVLESLSSLFLEGGLLFDRLVRRLELAGHPAAALRDELERAGQEGRLLLLFDGLDEVPRERRPEAEAFLRDLSGRWPATPIVVTTRPIGYQSPGREFREAEILPLDRGQRHELIARWLGRRSGAPEHGQADLQMAVLESSPPLWKLAGNPFYLTLMALLMEEGQQPSRHWTQIYDQVFELLLEGRQRPDGKPIPFKTGVSEALRYLAYGMTQDNRESEPVGNLEARLYRPEADSLRTALERVPPWQRSLRAFLDDVANLTSILGPHDGVDADWRFWHRSFREALTAGRLEEQLRKEGEAAILKHARGIAGEESRWAEPYALLVGRVPDPDALVRALTRENRALGLRSVATAQGLRDETLREILALSENWEQRSQVFLQIPKLVDDPERSLALLDRLRQGNRDGNDLYFLDQAAADVGRRWPDHAEPSGLLRRRLYSHIPPPEEALFQRIGTPANGQVELWCEIPDGTFIMGSAEGESRWKDEGPRHPVHLLGPFRLTAVPVTRAQFRAFDPGVSGGDEDHPVTGVTWFAAVSFCRWLSESFEWARGARLPTEEEWEIACRGGEETRYWSGDGEQDLIRVGWFLYNSGNRIHRVGEKPANRWGLHDMHGNVWEWTLGRPTRDYRGREAGFNVDPSGIRMDTIESGLGTDKRVLRGGSAWLGADFSRAAMRESRPPTWKCGDLGFRMLLPKS